MPDDRPVLRRVAWRELFPWLIIFRSFRLAISLPILFLATLGALLMPLGARVAERMLDGRNEIANAHTLVPADQVPGTPAVVADARQLVGEHWLTRGEDVTGVYRAFVDPVWRLFDPASTASRFLINVLVTLWNVAVWAFFGTAIARVAVVQLGRDERVGLGESLRFAARNYGWSFGAPLFPLVGVAFLAVPLALLGLLMRLDIGALLGGIVWPLVIIGGFIMAVLLLGLLGGWPLMWPTISAEEESDAFEAFSRSFSYTFQRPLQYLFYAALTILFGRLCWILVENFAEAIVALCHWGVSFGSGRARLPEILYRPREESNLLWAGGGLIQMWERFIRLIAHAFNFAFFFCAASAIYLLLRRHVDQTDFDEVYVPDEATRYGLPPLRTGPENVPQVDEGPDSPSE